MKKDGPWISWYASDFLNGIASLDHYEIAVYTVVLNRIYDEGGPIPDDAEEIARRCRMRLPQCIKALDRLTSMPGKLIRENGRLDNERARTELAKKQKRSKTATENIRQRWNSNKEKTMENNGAAIQTNKSGITEPILTTAIATTTSTSLAKPLDWSDLERSLRIAAGWQSETHPNLAVVGQIAALIESGADLDRDVLPIVKAKAPMVRKRTSWNFFVDPIREAWERRVALIGPAPKASTVDWQSFTERQYENAVLVAKRKGIWPESYGPADKIPKHLVDAELTAIIARSS